jgi:hypothetical protein
MEKFTTKKLVQTGLMLALALVFQIGFASFAQIAVGPLVNMVLFITAIMVSPISAIFVGVLTPLVAFLVGIMGLFPLVPVIAAGNALLVIVFSLIYSRKKLVFGEYIGLVVAALVKFGFLAMAVRVIVPMFVPKVPPVLVTALSFNQFLTAIAGGVLALIIVKTLNKVLHQKKS